MTPGSSRDAGPVFLVCPRDHILDLDTIEDRARVRADELPDPLARGFIIELQRDRSSALGPALAAGPVGPWLLQVPDGALETLSRSSSGDLIWAARDLAGRLGLSARLLTPLLNELKTLAQVALVQDANLVAVVRSAPPEPILPLAQGFPDRAPRDPVRKPGPRFLLAPAAGLGAIKTRQLNAEEVHHAPYLTRYRLPEMLAELLEGTRRFDLEALALHDAGPWIIPIPTPLVAFIAGADHERRARWAERCVHAWTYEPRRPTRLALRESLAALSDLAAEGLRRERPLLFASYEVPEMLPCRPARGDELAARSEAPPAEAPPFLLPEAEELAAQFRREDWRGKIALASQLAALKGRAACAVLDLTRALQDPDGRVRRWSAYALGEIGEAASEALTALSLAAWDEHPDVARAVAVAQQKIRDARSGRA